MLYCRPPLFRAHPGSRPLLFRSSLYRPRAVNPLDTTIRTPKRVAALRRFLFLIQTGHQGAPRTTFALSTHLRTHVALPSCCKARGSGKSVPTGPRKARYLSARQFEKSAKRQSTQMLPTAIHRTAVSRFAPQLSVPPLLLDVRDALQFAARYLLDSYSPL
jgi:hypothetical protein